MCWGLWTAQAGGLWCPYIPCLWTASIRCLRSNNEPARNRGKLTFYYTEDSYFITPCDIVCDGSQRGSNGNGASLTPFSVSGQILMLYGLKGLLHLLIAIPDKKADDCCKTRHVCGALGFLSDVF